MLKDEHGASAVEFVLILIPMMILVFGFLNMSVMLYVFSTLHFASQDAARCASVKTDICSGTVATQAYAAGVYTGPGTGVGFVHTLDANCGNRVTGSVVYNFSTGVTNTPVTLTANACYPLA